MVSNDSLPDGAIACDCKQTFRQRLRKPLISALIVLILYCGSLWILPDSAGRSTLLEPFTPVILYIGLCHKYTMFAPNPKNINLDIDAKVTFSDGSTTVWQYPRIERLGLYERIQKERFRKFGIDHLKNDDHRLLWPDFARWVARINDSGGRHPVRIELERNWADVPPPAVGIGSALPRHWRKFLFYTYGVASGDLK